MANLKNYVTSLFLTFSLTGWAQKSLADKLAKLEVKQKPFTNYVDKSGKTIGCDWNLECTGFAVKFYSVSVDETTGEMRVKGRTYLPSHSRVDSMDRIKYGDTVGLFSVHIFLAKPFKQTLIEVPGMSFSSTDHNDIEFAKFPAREGDFDISLKVDREARLYFVGYNHRLKEYEIGRLLEQGKAKSTLSQRLTAVLQ